MKIAKQYYQVSQRRCSICIPGVLQTQWDKALSNLVWIQCWHCFELNAGLGTSWGPIHLGKLCDPTAPATGSIMYQILERSCQNCLHLGAWNQYLHPGLLRSTSLHFVQHNWKNLHSFTVLTLGSSWSKETMLSSDSALPLRAEDCNQMYASKKYSN